MIATNESTAFAHVFAETLKSNKSKLFNVSTYEIGEGQRQLRYAASLANHEYRELDLNQIYPTDIEETFKSLPDKSGVIVIANYDEAHEYLVTLINFVLRYYEYRTMISSNKSKVQVSNKWRFIILNKPGYRFDPIVYRNLYHVNM
jgi:hypothetical protein